MKRLDLARIPDWQLPPGIDRGLWDYLLNEPLAARYDDSLAFSPLLQTDIAFAERHFQQPGRLIDLGCGTGRLLIPFAKRGYWCLGVDLSAAMLRMAIQKSATEAVSVAFLKANLVELDAIADIGFDYAACLFSTFGMIRGFQNRRKMLAHTQRILRPNGRLVLHVHHRWFHGGFGLGKKGLEPGDRQMPQHHAGAELTLHHFTLREIQNELAIAGFRILEVQRVAVSQDGKLHHSWWLQSFRTYGFLIAAERLP